MKLLPPSISAEFRWTRTAIPTRCPQTDAYWCSIRRTSRLPRKDSLPATNRRRCRRSTTTVNPAASFVPIVVLNSTASGVVYAGTFAAQNGFHVTTRPCAGGRCLSNSAVLVGTSCAKGSDHGHGLAAGGVVGVCARFDSGAATATLRRCRLRLGLSREYDQRSGGVARPPARRFSFTVSADRSGAVSRDARRAG